MYAKITSTKKGADALEYVLGSDSGRGHNGNKDRNLLVTSVNMMPPAYESYVRQMERVWATASANHKIQIRRIMLCFSERELDPNDPESAFIAAEIATDVAEKIYPDRQVVIGVQKDGKSGLVHAHVDVNDVSLIDGKGCTEEQYSFIRYDKDEKCYIKDKFDRIAKEHFAKYDIEFDHGINTKNRMVLLERAKVQGHRKDKYVWKEDLKERITGVMNTAVSRDDFIKKLSERGVEVTFKSEKIRERGEDGKFRDTGKTRDYILYELKDLSGFKDKKDIPKDPNGKLDHMPLKGKSYKLGSDFDLGELDLCISRNRSAAKKQKNVSAGSSTGKKKTSMPATTEVPVMIKIDNSEDQHDLYKFMHLAEIDVINCDPKTAGERLEEGKKRWAEFKDAYPDDYRDRLDRDDIALPAPVEIEEPVATTPAPAPAEIEKPVTTTPAPEPVLKKQPTEKLHDEEPEVAAAQEAKINLKNRREKLLKSTEAYDDLIAAYDKLHEIEVEDDWKKPE